MSIKNDKMIKSLLCILIILNEKCSTFGQATPIGNARNEDFNNDFVDHETIQGLSWRTVGYDKQNDPKNIFFLRMELDEKNSPESGDDLGKGSNDKRSKRQADDQIVDTGTIKLDAHIEDEFSTQHQELDPPDTLQMSTEIAPSTTEIRLDENYSKNNFIPINDFIRFRRGLIPGAKGENVQSDSSSSSMGEGQKFNLENENLDMQNNRGTRGLSTEEWVKFPYQVQRSQKSDDSFASPSDFSKPRRVHFITQKKFEVESPSLSSNSRQGRVIDQPRASRDQPREPRVEMEVRKSPELFTPRFSRDFDGPSDYPAFPYSRGRYYERDLIENRRPDSRSLDFYPRNRDRRIIYYANLPEIPRNPPRFREMERYRDSFEDRYSVNPYRRGFYRDQRNEEMPPMKVSADINVREVKKNPEKRIYSDVKRKYGYNGPPFDGDQSSTRH